MEHAIKIILDSTILLQLISVSIGASRENKQEPQKRLFYYLSFYLSIEIIAYITILYGVENNQWLYNILGLVEVWALFNILSYYTKPRMKKLLKVLMMACYGIIIINALVYSDPFILGYYNYGFAIYSTVLCGVGMTILFGLLQSDDVLEIHRSFGFWLIIGLLFFHLCRLPIVIIGNIYYSVFTKDNPVILIEPFSFILMHICFIIGFIWSKDQNYSSTLS